MSDEPQGSNLCLRKNQTSSRDKFYKANYAIKCRNVLQTKGVACAVNLYGQQEDKTRDSVLLLTWKGCIEETNDNLVMYRFSRKHFGQYHLNSSRLCHDENFSLIECNCSDVSKQSKNLWEVRLEIQCLKREEQMKDFIVYTTNGVKCLDLTLECNKTTGNHHVIDKDHFDLKLCGAPIIDQNKCFVGVLRKDPDHANKFIPCFISQGELDRLKEKQEKAIVEAQERNREEPVAEDEPVLQLSPTPVEMEHPCPEIKEKEAKPVSWDSPEPVENDHLGPGGPAVVRHQPKEAEDGSPMQESNQDFHSKKEEGASFSKPVQESDSADSRVELSASSKPVQESDQAGGEKNPTRTECVTGSEKNPARTECVTGFFRELSDLPRPCRTFVNRDKIIEDIKTYLRPGPENKYSCVFVHGAAGMGKSATAIKAANEIREKSDNNAVVYINCCDVCSFDDLAEKIYHQIYRFPSQDSTSKVKRRLMSEKDLFVILLMDNFQYLEPMGSTDKANMNPEIKRIDPTEGSKIKKFISEIIAASTNVKLLVTSSVKDFLPDIHRRVVELRPLEKEASIELLKISFGPDIELEEENAGKILEVSDGMPLALISLASWGDHPADLVQMLNNADVKRLYNKLAEIPTTDPRKKINSCFDACFCYLDQNLQDTLIRLALFRGHFTLTTAKTVFPSEEVEDHVLKLARRSLLEKNILGPKDLCYYSLLTVQKLYCQNKAQEGRLLLVYNNGRKRFIGHFLSFLDDAFERFLSKDAFEACATFRREVENIMQLLDWFESDAMDKEQRLRCIDVFNKAAELLAKMMGEKRFNAVFNMLKGKCQQLQDKKRLSDCLTSLGIKEAFSCFFSPHLSLEAGERARNYFIEADRIQSDLQINTGNSRAQCLAKYGRCVSIDGKFCKGKEMITKAIDIRKGHGKEDGVMLGATYNDLAVVLSLEAAHHQEQHRQKQANALFREAVEFRTRETLPIYREKLGDHPFTATILNNLSKNYRALEDFEGAKKCSEEALKIRRYFLREHMETALSLFEVAMVLKEINDLQAAKTNFEQCLAMQRKVLDEKHKDLESTKKELEEVCKRLEDKEKDDGMKSNVPPAI